MGESPSPTPDVRPSMTGSRVDAQPAAVDPVETVGAAVAQLRDGLATLALTSRYSRDELDTIYALGWSHLSRHQADTALRFFLFLIDYAPTDETYLMGLGVCLQQLERPRDALAVFSWVGTLDAGNVESSLRSAECLLALRERQAAEALLDCIVVEAMASSSKPTHVAYRAQALLDVLRRGGEGDGRGDGGGPASVPDATRAAPLPASARG